MYKALSQILMAAALSAGLVASAGAQGIGVRVNDDPVRFSGIGPQQVNGRVMVPLRGVLEKLGAFVDWVPSTQTVVASRGNMDLQLRIGSRTATVNGREVTLDVPAMTMGGSTMVPLRFVGETLGADVRWEGATQTVRITTNDAGGRTDAVRTADDDLRDREAARLRDAARRERIRRRDQDANTDPNRDPIRDPNRDPIRDPIRGRDPNRDVVRDPVVDPNRSVAVPTISSIRHDRRSGWLRPGNVVTVTMRGTPGGEGAFRVPGVAEEVRMRETQPGLYEGTWTVPGSKPVNIREASVIGSLKMPGGDTRSVPLVQAGDSLQIDTVAPLISDLTPAPSVQTPKAQPLISGTFSDQGGSGVVPEKVRLLVDGRDVTADATITPNFFTYKPSAALAAAEHSVDVFAYDEAGNEAHKAWRFGLAGPAARERGIEKLQVSIGRNGTPKPGDVVNVRVEGTPGGRVIWNLGTLKNYPLHEDQPGVYVGAVRLRDVDSLEDAHLTATMTLPNGRKFTDTSEQAFTMRSGPPAAPIITFPTAADRLANPLVVRGTAPPNSTVRLKIDYTSKVLGLLGVKGTTSQVDVPVNAAGKWETGPINLSNLPGSRGTEYTLSAVTVNASAQESAVTTLKFR